MSDNMNSLEKQEFVLGVHEDETIKQYKEWNRAKAESLARQMQVMLSKEHWQVIDFLRLHFANTGPVRHARDISQVLNERFATQGGARYLYELFPGGPVSVGCKLAGVPVPPDARDAHFGTTQ